MDATRLCVLGGCTRRGIVQNGGEFERKREGG